MLIDLMKKLDLTDEWFGELQAKESVHINGVLKWRCVCKCGNECYQVTSNLTRGLVKSCGCKQNAPTHGMTKSPEYRSWQHMKQRCLNENSDSYKYYGDNNRKICERWIDSFENFYEDMGKRPTPQHTLERIDNEGDYCPENCKWATRAEQLRNTSRIRFVDIDGDVKPIGQWAQIFGMPNQTLDYRIREKGMPPKIAIGMKRSRRFSESNWWDLPKYKKEVYEALAGFEEKKTASGYEPTGG